MDLYTYWTAGLLSENPDPQHVGAHPYDGTPILRTAHGQIPCRDLVAALLDRRAAPGDCWTAADLR